MFNEVERLYAACELLEVVAILLVDCLMQESQSMSIFNFKIFFQWRIAIKALMEYVNFSERRLSE